MKLTLTLTKSREATLLKLANGKVKATKKVAQQLLNNTLDTSADMFKLLEDQQAIAAQLKERTPSELENN